MPVAEKEDLNNKLTINNLKKITIECLVLYPLLISLLLLAMSYNSSGMNFLLQCLESINKSNFDITVYVKTVFNIFILCLIVYIIIFGFFASEIHFNFDFFKRLLTLLFPVVVFCFWKNYTDQLNSYYGFIKKQKFWLISNQNQISKFTFILVIFITYIFSQFFEYINSYSKNKWWIKDPVKYGGSAFKNKRYYLVSLCISAMTILFENKLHTLAVVVIDVILFIIAFLLDFNRNSINNFFANFIAIITYINFKSPFGIQLFFCIVISLYLSEQILLWLNTYEKSKKHSDVMNTLIKNTLSSYGILGTISFIIILIIEKMLKI